MFRVAILVCLAVSDDAGNIIRTISSDQRVDGLSNEEARTFDVNFDLRGIPGGEYNVLLGVFEGKTPIKIALKEEAEAGLGFYKICRRTVREL